jgi:hypothetical protein
MCVSSWVFIVLFTGGNKGVRKVMLTFGAQSEDAGLCASICESIRAEDDDLINRVQQQQDPMLDAIGMDMIATLGGGEGNKVINIAINKCSSRRGDRGGQTRWGGLRCCRGRKCRG